MRTGAVTNVFTAQFPQTSGQITISHAGTMRKVKGCRLSMDSSSTGNGDPFWRRAAIMARMLHGLGGGRCCLHGKSLLIHWIALLCRSIPAAGLPAKQAAAGPANSRTYGFCTAKNATSPARLPCAVVTLPGRRCWISDNSARRDSGTIQVAPACRQGEGYSAMWPLASRLTV